MNKSNDCQEIIKALLRSKIIKPKSQKKGDHQKYVIHPNYALAPVRRQIIAPNAHTSGNDIRSGANFISYLNKMLKPGVLDDAMGWTNPLLAKKQTDVVAVPEPKTESDILAIVESANKFSGAALIPVSVIPKQDRKDLFSEFSPASTHVDRSSIERAAHADHVPSHLQTIEDIVEPPKVQAAPRSEASRATGSTSCSETSHHRQRYTLDMKVPDRVAIDSRNQVIGQEHNRYVDRADELKIHILDRDRTIRSLQELNETERKEFKSISLVIEQLSMALIALSYVETPMTPKVETPEPVLAVAPPPPPPVTHTAPATVRAIRLLPPSQIIAEADKYLAERSPVALSISQILDHLKDEKGIAPAGKHPLNNMHNALHTALKGGKVNFERLERGLYSHKSE
jgi:hypothetical protein